MIVYPNTKINLGLQVLSKRPDGYHELETLFVPYFGFKDRLEINPSDSSQSSIKLIGGDWNPFEDLSFRAWQLMRDEYGIPAVDIVLTKSSPVGAGLGGGSADAAFMLIALNDLFSLGLGQGRLASLAAELGSDCPFFIYNRPMFATGRGEILSPYELDLNGYRIEVAVPEGVSVSTREAYSRLLPRDKWQFDTSNMSDYADSSTNSQSSVSNDLEQSVRDNFPLKEILLRPIEQWKELLVNDFEPCVFAAHPEIAKLKAKFYSEGAIYASMSGSGSAVFCLKPE